MVRDSQATVGQIAGLAAALAKERAANAELTRQNKLLLNGVISLCTTLNDSARADLEAVIVDRHLHTDECVDDHVCVCKRSIWAMLLTEALY